MVSDVLREREAVTVNMFNDNKQKELKYTEIGLHMKCWNPHVLCKCVLIVCSRAFIQARMGVMLSVCVTRVVLFNGRDLDGPEQLQLIFKTYLLKTTQKCLADLSLKQCNQFFSPYGIRVPNLTVLWNSVQVGVCGSWVWWKCVVYFFLGSHFLL